MVGSNQIEEGMPLWAFAPDNIVLRSFVQCEGVDGALFICDNVDLPNYSRAIRLGDMVLKSHYVELWDMVGAGSSRGYLIKPRPGIVPRYLGRQTLSLSRIIEPDICPITEWNGSWLRLIEGDNGCLLLSNCKVDNVATRRMDLV